MGCKAMASLAGLLSALLLQLEPEAGQMPSQGTRNDKWGAEGTHFPGGPLYHLKPRTINSSLFQTLAPGSCHM